MARHRIGVIGLGKIAQDQHLPVIARSDAFELVAVSSLRGLSVDGVPHVFRSPEELLSSTPDLEAVAICTPPQVRHHIAKLALEAGKDVMLEKPPTATISELSDLARIAAERGRVLFTTWHSQYNAAVDEAKRRLTGETVAEMFVNWKEDVRKWHPGQPWIWEPGGFGVFDPGINALSIVTKIMPNPVFLTRADLLTPSNAATPIAAELEFATVGPSAPLRAEFDWRQMGEEVWEITVRTARDSTLVLSGGGSRLTVDGQEVVREAPDEYARIYQYFDALLREGKSHVDAAPFELVADAFLLGRRLEVEAFHE
jgi:D-galactose 1-dehydrogenase